MKVCIYQYDIEWLSPKKNVSLIRNKIESIKSGVDLIILPEMFLTGFCMDPSLSAIKEDGDSIKELSNMAEEFGLAIMGSLAIEEGGKYYNRVLLITSEGIVGRYDKQYLYSPSGENQAFDSKYEPKLIQYKGWNILPQVCYDLRFPENVRQLPAPDLLIYMANWPVPRIHHWDTLLKARAIENQCYTIGCNRLGKDGNEWEYSGHSVVIKPDGIIMDTNANSEVYQLQKDTIEGYRAKYRFLDDKKI